MENGFAPAHYVGECVPPDITRHDERGLGMPGAYIPHHNEQGLDYSTVYSVAETATKRASARRRSESFLRKRERERVPSGVVPLMQAGWKAWEMVRKLSVQGNIEWVEPQVLDGWIDLGSCRFLFTPCPVLLLYHILF
jgi:hypothetical protein